MTEFIIHADLDYLSRALLSEHITYSRTETADNVMLFNCEHLACLACSLNDKVCVDRLDGVDIDNFSVDTLSFEQPR